jgi:NhaP-type Na+/H+ or K+/H+ antiporter
MIYAVIGGFAIGALLGWAYRIARRRLSEDIES